MRSLLLPSAVCGAAVLLAYPAGGLRAQQPTTPPLANSDSALFAAIDSADIALVTRLLDRGANPHAEGDYLETPLLRAAAADSPELVSLFLARGADPNARDQDGDGALGYYLPHFGSGPEIVDTLLKHGADPTLPNRQGVTPLMFAVSAGVPEVIGRLSQAGADPNQPDLGGDVALGYYLTLSVESTRSADTLLGLGANPNAQNQGLLTPLMFAADAGHAHVARSLLDHGADPFVVDSAGVSALHYAAKTGAVDVINVLLDAGLPVDHRDMHGRTPLLMAIGGGERTAIEMLKGAGADIEVRDTDGNHPLIYAALLGQPGVLAVLLNWGLDPNAPGHNGSTPLLAAAASSNTNSVKILLAAGADVNRRNHEGSTALMAAAEAGDPGVVRSLLDAGAVVDPVNVHGKDALRYAEEGGQSEIVLALLSAGANSDRDLGDGPASLSPGVREAELPAVLPTADDFGGAVLESQGPRDDFGGDAYGRSFGGSGELTGFVVGTRPLLTLETIASRYPTGFMARQALEQLHGRGAEVARVLSRDLGVPESATTRIDGELDGLGDAAVSARFVIATALTDVEITYVGFVRGEVLAVAYSVAADGDGRVDDLAALLTRVDARLVEGRRLSDADRAALTVVVAPETGSDPDDDAVFGTARSVILPPGAAVRDNVDLAGLALDNAAVGIQDAAVKEVYLDGAAAGTFTRTWENWVGTGIAGADLASPMMSQAIAFYHDAAAATNDFVEFRNEALALDADNLSRVFDLFGADLGEETRIQSVSDLEVGELGVEMALTLQVEVLQMDLLVVSFLRDRFLITFVMVTSGEASAMSWLRDRARELDERLSNASRSAVDGAEEGRR